MITRPITMFSVKNKSNISGGMGRISIPMMMRIRNGIPKPCKVLFETPCPKNDITMLPNLKSLLIN
jgi:hypothetical protein